MAEFILAIIYLIAWLGYCLAIFIMARDEKLKEKQNMNKLKQLLKWNRFTGVSQFMDIDKKQHIIVWTRNAMYEYDPTGKTKVLFTLKAAEAVSKKKDKS